MGLFDIFKRAPNQSAAAASATPSRSQPQVKAPGLVPCDLCSSAVTATQAGQMTADQLRSAVSAGFSIRAITWGATQANLNQMKQQAVASGWGEAAMLSAYEAEWKRTVMRDDTNWNYCSTCHSVLKILGQSKVTAYSFQNPKLFSGFPLQSLRRVLVHIPEQTSDPVIHPDFVSVLSDTVGAPASNVIGSVHLDVVTGSYIGDEVQRTGKLPEKATELINLVAPEMKDTRRFEHHARIFFSASKDHYGVLVAFYELK